jgi:hypothetical protein
MFLLLTPSGSRAVLSRAPTAFYYALLTAVLPPWFSTVSADPLLTAVLTAYATTLSFVYSLWAYAKLQTRIATATDGWLDVAGADYLGPGFYRHSGQTDAGLRLQIMQGLLAPKGTRAALISALKNLTGRTPVVVEFNRPSDTGVYGGPYAGYGLAGAYGSLVSGMNAFVIAYRPLTVGAAPYAYIPSDAEIIAATEAVRPAGYTLWIRISN